MKPMKIHLDLESPSPSNSNFWIKKWHEWRNKHRHRKQQCTESPPPPPHNIPKRRIPHGIGIGIARPPHFGDTQSELGARRSCDTDPRFSVDAGPLPRFSFDEPRASWDGYLVSGRPVYSRLHPTLSVLEDAPDPVIRRSDDQIPVEYDRTVPGSQAQTREYYLDSSSRHRRSFERSISMRKAPQIEIETEHRSIPTFNSKVSPAGGAEFYHYHHAIATRDEMSESFDSVFRDPRKSQIAEKKQKKWTKGWNLWGLIHKKGNSSKDQSANVVDAPFPEAWRELQPSCHNGGTNHFLRSNSSVSARSSFSGSSASMRRNSVDINGYAKGYGNKRRDEFNLERNRSARFSPGRVDNGMLRFYLTPMRGSQSGRRNSGVRPVSTNSQSLSSRSVHRLY